MNLETFLEARRNLEDALSTHTKLRDRYRDEAMSLESEYSGVRPGWVSTDIALAWDRYRIHAAIVDEIKRALA